MAISTHYKALRSCFEFSFPLSSVLWISLCLYSIFTYICLCMERHRASVMCMYICLCLLVDRIPHAYFSFSLQLYSFPSLYFFFFFFLFFFAFYPPLYSFYIFSKLYIFHLIFDRAMYSAGHTGWNFQHATLQSLSIMVEHIFF